MARRASAVHPRLEEEFERIVLSLLSADAAPRVVLVTALARGEGTSTVAGGLARAVLEVTDKRVLIVDGNFLNPTIHRAFDLKISPGLRDWSSGPPPIQSAQLPHGEIAVLTAGNGPVRERHKQRINLYRQFLEETVNLYDLVIWDSAPLSDTRETLALAQLTDGALVVLEADRSKVGRLKFLKNELDRIDVPILGAVFNRSGRFTL